MPVFYGVHTILNGLIENIAATDASFHLTPVFEVKYLF